MVFTTATKHISLGIYLHIDFVFCSGNVFPIEGLPAEPAPATPTQQITLPVEVTATVQREQSLDPQNNASIESTKQYNIY